MTKQLTQDFDMNCDSGAHCSLSTALALRGHLQTDNGHPCFQWFILRPRTFVCIQALVLFSDEQEVGTI